MVGLNNVVWGIIHDKLKYFAPDFVQADENDEDPSIWHVVCADAHASDITNTEVYTGTTPSDTGTTTSTLKTNP